MQASKVVAAKAARVKTKDKYPWFLLYESPVPTLLILFFFYQERPGPACARRGPEGCGGLVWPPRAGRPPRRAGSHEGAQRPHVRRRQTDQARGLAPANAGVRSTRSTSGACTALLRAQT